MTAIGLGLVIVGVVAYFAMIFALHRFTYRTWIFDVVVGVGALSAALGWATGSNSAVAIITLALAVVWFVVSRLELRLHGSPRLALTVGSQLPAVRMTTVDGEVVTDEDLRRHAPVLLVLYRGWWCPSSKHQLGELLDEYDRLIAAGLTIYAASVDQPEQAAPLQAHVGDRITILCGVTTELLDAVGADDSRGAPWYDRVLFGVEKQDIAMPTSLVIDHEGRIVFAQRANQLDDRLDPSQILASL